ncbi:hypothetical protein PFISCL1PPCAC_20946 [Pristionchus fissidentatus]|uniref:BTB domain-containing protein n=1 Tax=Pristionchus fissidentatus TaxID=1538716 RepID=A0AAV5WIN3_9BILA|nr:hypothetical protein PFISCL1PPCAC_20946 [Pristionchus fissidentatus]
MAVESAVLRWEFDNVSELTEDLRYSPILYIADLPWRIGVQRVHSSDDVSHLGVFLFCNEENEGNQWRVEHESTLELVNSDNWKYETKSIRKPFTSRDSEWGRKKFIDFERLLRDSGFTKDDKMTFVALIHVKKVEGITRPPAFDFTAYASNITNFTFVFDEKRLRVSKQFLAIHSSVFHSMFFSNQNYAYQYARDEKKLDNVTYEDFLELLRVLYSTGRKITYYSEKSLLELADRYEIYSVKAMVERYLMETEEISMFIKLERADRYKLNTLKKHCLSTFKSLTELKKLFDSSSFSHEMKAGICERMIDLIE